MNGFNEQARTSVPINSRYVLAFVISLCGIFLTSHNAHAMSFDQMKTLAGTALLDLRVDAVLKDCGLPSVIVDTAGVSPQRPTLRWGNVKMKLSSMNWELIYSRQREVANPGSGWINPGFGNATCLSGLSGLVVQAKGDVGFLSVKKREDNKGYRTSYHVPDNLYAAHQVIGLSGSWIQGMPVSRILERYGKPDEILGGEGGARHYLYWVVVKQKEMPVSVHEVDFEVSGAEKICTRYSVHTSGFEYVQEKLDALQRQWERDYVLD